MTGDPILFAQDAAIVARDGVGRLSIAGREYAMPPATLRKLALDALRAARKLDGRRRVIALPDRRNVRAAP